MVRLHWTVRWCQRWHCLRGRHIVHEQPLLTVGDRLYLTRSCLRPGCRWTDRRRLPPLQGCGGA